MWPHVRNRGQLILSAWKPLQLAMYNLVNKCLCTIRQHGSAVYVGMVVVVCIIIIRCGLLEVAW